MGHGDIKMMRGVGALLGPALLCANMGIAVVAGLVIGLAMLAIASRTQSEEPPSEDEEEIAPESIVSLLIHGAWYLFCLDIVGIFVPNIYKWIGETPSEENLEDDDWKPSLTTIPFGPYLAIGAIVCMLFAGPINKAISDYMLRMSHPAAMTTPYGREFAGMRSNRLNWGPARIEARGHGNRGATLRETCRCARGGMDWNVTMRAGLAVTVGNNAPLLVVTQAGVSGVKDAC